MQDAKAGARQIPDGRYVKARQTSNGDFEGGGDGIAGFGVLPEPTFERGKQEMSERDRIYMEAHWNASSDEYFAARPQLDSAFGRTGFEAGFQRGWERALSFRDVHGNLIPSEPFVQADG